MAFQKIPSPEARIREGRAIDGLFIVSIWAAVWGGAIVIDSWVNAGLGELALLPRLANLIVSAVIALASGIAIMLLSQTRYVQDNRVITIIAVVIFFIYYAAPIILRFL